jgi:hypothetical protein
MPPVPLVACRATNLCTAIRSTQGKGVMPDGTSRFSLEGKPLHHYMGTSTFAHYTVLPEIAVAKIRDDAPFDGRSSLRRTMLQARSHRPIHGAGVTGCSAFAEHDTAASLGFHREKVLVQETGLYEDASFSCN